MCIRGEESVGRTEIALTQAARRTASLIRGGVVGAARTVGEARGRGVRVKWTLGAELSTTL